MRARIRSPLSALAVALALFASLCMNTAAQASISVYDSNDVLQVGATSATMAQLLGGWYIDINNGFDTKRFDGFRNYASAGTDNFGNAIAGVLAGQLTAHGIDNQNLDPGPGLTFSGNFFAMAQNGGTQAGTQDTSFTFDVSVLQPSNYVIKDIGLELGAGFVGADDGQIIVLEQVVSPFAQAKTYIFDTPGGIVSQPYDMDLLSPVATKITVKKDIFLRGGTGGFSEFTSLTDLDQTFSQAYVPEPSSMAIAGLGALGLIGYGLRRRRSV